MLTGRCLCGEIRYAAKGPISQQTNCHCSLCRRASAAPFVTWFSVPANNFTVTAGHPARFDSSAHGYRTFCPRCGTQLTFQSQESPSEIDITVCSLDDPENVAPVDHTFTRTALSWVKLADDMPRHPGARLSSTARAASADEIE